MKNTYLLLLSCFISIGFAQNITVNSAFTPQQLVQDVLVNNNCITVSNVSVSGGNFGTGELSYGYFNANGSVFPLQEGIVLSTGKINSVVGPNANFSDDGTGIGWNGDNDLNAALGLSNTFNATVLEFDFVSNANNINFEYLFSSEQYLSNPSPAQCNFTDGFAFLLKEASASTYQNLALVPNTTIPVRVNTVRGSGTICTAANELYFDAFNTGNYPTAFDGQTKILTAKSSIIPGVLYHIKLVIADEGNARFDSGIFLKAGSFTSEKDLGIDRLIATGNPVCANENLVLNATQAGATNYQWFLDENPIGSNTSTLPVLTAGNYSVQISLGSACTISGSIQIEFAPNLIIADTNFDQCDTNNDGFTNFNLQDLKSQIFTNLPSNFTLEFFSAISSVNPLPMNWTNTTAFQQTIFARITNIQNCYGSIPIVLNVNVFSEEFNPETIAICNTNPVTITAPAGYNNYTWNTNPIQNTPFITVDSAGEYEVSFTNTNNCSRTKTFTVTATETATITTIEVTDFDENLSATVFVNENGSYTYSLDGSFYQDSPVFALNNPGEYTVFVKEENCGVVSQTFYALAYPKFFTPNGDSFNDTWQIKNLDKKGLEKSRILIFDRYGKLLKQLAPLENGWDGFFNGSPLPSSDYWFVLELTNGKTIKGNFSLKR